jgi:hypothetical protein
MREGHKNVVLNMQNERAKFVPTWWRIGESLRYYLEVPTELPPKLLTLVRQLDAIEGKYLSRNLDVTRDVPHEPNREEKETPLGSCRPAHVNLTEKSA